MTTNVQIVHTDKTNGKQGQGTWTDKRDSDGEM